MAYKYLGGTEFDFHGGGGSDLIFPPHHENEIAQSEAATGKPLARFWVHNGMLNLKDTKMSKSLGNVISVNQMVKRYPKELLRFYLLSTHYRSGLEYYEGKIEEVKRGGWSRLNAAVRALKADLQQAETGPEGGFWSGKQRKKLMGWAMICWLLSVTISILPGRLVFCLN